MAFERLNFRQLFCVSRHAIGLSLISVALLLGSQHSSAASPNQCLAFFQGDGSLELPDWISADQAFASDVRGTYNAEIARLLVSELAEISTAKFLIAAPTAKRIETKVEELIGRTNEVKNQIAQTNGSDSILDPQTINRSLIKKNVAIMGQFDALKAEFESLKSQMDLITAENSQIDSVYANLVKARQELENYKNHLQAKLTEIRTYKSSPRNQALYDITGSEIHKIQLKQDGLEEVIAASLKKQVENLIVVDKFSGQLDTNFVNIIVATGYTKERAAAMKSAIDAFKAKTVAAKKKLKARIAMVLAIISFSAGTDWLFDHAGQYKVEQVLNTKSHQTRTANAIKEQAEQKRIEAANRKAEQLESARQAREAAEQQKHAEERLGKLNPQLAEILDAKSKDDLKLTAVRTYLSNVQTVSARDVIAIQTEFQSLEWGMKGGIANFTEKLKSYDSTDSWLSFYFTLTYEAVSKVNLRGMKPDDIAYAYDTFDKSIDAHLSDSTFDYTLKAEFKNDLKAGLTAKFKERYEASLKPVKTNNKDPQAAQSEPDVKPAGN